MASFFHPFLSVSACLWALHSSVHTACQESGPWEGRLGPAVHGLPRAWIPELLCWGERGVTPQVNRSLNCRCQGLVSISSSAVQASTPQNGRQLFKEIKAKVIVAQCKTFDSNHMKSKMWTNITWGVPNNSTQDSEKITLSMKSSKMLASPKNPHRVGCIPPATTMNEERSIQINLCEWLGDFKYLIKCLCPKSQVQQVSRRKPASPPRLKGLM